MLRPKKGKIYEKGAVVTNKNKKGRIDIDAEGKTVKEVRQEMKPLKKKRNMDWRAKRKAVRDRQKELNKKYKDRKVMKTTYGNY